MIVNKANSVTGLSKLQVRDVFAGNVSDWHDVGGQSNNIHVIARIEGSGTRAMLRRRGDERYQDHRHRISARV